MKYTSDWESLTKEMGYWIDMSDPYVTFHSKYMESVWWIIKEIYSKNLIYKGYTVQPYSPAAGSGLSSHELNQPGAYKQISDTSIVAQFKCKKDGLSNELINIYPKTYSTPETRFDVDETKKFLIIEEIKERIKNTEGEIIDIDGIRVENDYGWFLMRASNTQNQLTCRAESTSQEGLKSLIAIIENQLSLSAVNYKFTV